MHTDLTPGAPVWGLSAGVEGVEAAEQATAPRARGYHAPFRGYNLGRPVA
jgi:hypothetical protein